MEQGLAQSMARAPQEGSLQEAQQDAQGRSPDEMIQQVVQLLMQGANPDDLIQQGIPMEIVRQAIQIILAQQEQEQSNNSAPATDGGLAMSSAGRV